MNRYNFQHSLRISFALRISLLTILVVGFLVLVAQVSAQDRNQWPAPRQIPGYAPDSSPPILIADQNRTVHAFNSTWVENERVLVYSQWTKSTGWTIPVDIILPQLKSQARVNGAYLDQNGLVHLVFFSGDELKAGIFYSSGPLNEAEHAQAWSKPTLIGQHAESFPEEAAIVSDSNGGLFVLYSAKKPSPGLYAVHSSDGGTSWSEPAPIFLTYYSGSKPNALKIHIDSDGYIHAVWDVVNGAGHSEGIYYAHLEPGQSTWSEPVQLSADVIGVPNAPSIVNYNDELFVVFHSNTATGLTRFMVRSGDGGESWSERVRLFDHVGSNGEFSFAIDSDERLHGFFGNRLTVDEVTTHGMWHSTWEGKEWSTPQEIVSGPLLRDREGEGGFDPSFANAVLSQGNVPLVTWISDPAAGQNGVWYSFSTLETPELTLMAPPTTAQISVPTVVSTSDELPTSVAVVGNPPVSPEVTPQAAPAPTDGSPMIPVFVSLVPIVVLVLAIPISKLLLQIWRTRGT